MFLRNATAYGLSPRLRGDLVVNNLVGFAVTTGEVLLKSDGTPWRPLVHIDDIAAAILAVLEAPADLVRNEAFNVGRTEENYRIRDVAELVEEAVPGSVVGFAAGAGPDMRNYRVNCDKLPASACRLPAQVDGARGVGELRDAYQRHGLTPRGPDRPRLRSHHATSKSSRTRAGSIPGCAGAPSRWSTQPRPRRPL